MKGKRSEKEVFICDCWSPEHQFTLTYSYGDDEFDYDSIDIEMHLSPRLGFWKRVVTAVKYIFGYKSKYGNWDCFSFDYDKCDKLIHYLQKLKTDYETIHKKIGK